MYGFLQHIWQLLPFSQKFRELDLLIYSGDQFRVDLIWCFYVHQMNAQWLCHDDSIANVVLRIVSALRELRRHSICCILSSSSSSSFFTFPPLHLRVTVSFTVRVRVRCRLALFLRRITKTSTLSSVKVTVDNILHTKPNTELSVSHTQCRLHFFHVRKCTL